MISTGMTGTARQEMNPEERQHHAREHVAARGAAARADGFARTQPYAGPRGSPIILRAKYALTLALMSKAPSRNNGQPP